MFTKSLLSAAFAATAIAAPAPAVVQNRAAGDTFSLIALHSTSAVHLQSINANDKAFYVGRDTTSFCPDVSSVTCPAGTATAFVAGEANGGLGMDTLVPGGQNVFIDKFGVLRFTTAHSGVTPEGAILDGWTYTPPADGQVVGFLTHGDDAALACPSQDNGYLIFIQTGPISIPEGCINISLGAVPFEGAGAWQYE